MPFFVTLQGTSYKQTEPVNIFAVACTDDLSLSLEHITLYGIGIGPSCLFFCHGQNQKALLFALSKVKVVDGNKRPRQLLVLFPSAALLVGCCQAFSLYAI